jgi:hypothetical protein
MEYKPFLRLRHVFQTDQTWWDFYAKYSNRIRSAVLDTMLKLFACGTPAMGFATFRCEHHGCGHTKRIAFSCKSRYCPTCGNKATEQWVQAQLNVLPVTQWQHITFTMPCQLWPLFAANRRLLNCLSTLAAKVCLDWCATHGVTPGIFTALHTHGRDGCWHPHVHLSITAGGLTKDEIWKKVTFHRESLMKQWRYQIITLLRQEYPNLILPKLLKTVGESKATWNKFLEYHYDRYWNIHIAKPTEDARQTINYLSRYLKRPPISYTRLTHYNGRTVTYTFTSHRTNKTETIELSTEEFIKRFARHIHDRCFRVIRYYGFLATRVRTKLLPAVYKVLNQSVRKVVKITHAAMLKRFVKVDPRACILCGGRMLFSGMQYGKSLAELREHHQALATMKFC